MSYVTFELAGDAIRNYVAGRHAENLDTWELTVPADDWGYETDEWRGPATDIVNDFNKRLPENLSVTVTGSDKDKYCNKRLIEFQRFLAACADKRAATLFLAALGA
ncbi:MAG: hypothetical protein WDN44_14025 [Sphingomonas sp.]